MNTPLHEEARSYGIDPLTNTDWEEQTLRARETRQAKHAPQQPDVDSGNAEKVTPLSGETKMKETNVIQPPSKTTRSTRRKG